MLIYFFFSGLICSLFTLSFQKEQLISKEFTAYSFSDASTWNINRISSCSSTQFVDFSGASVYGQFGNQDSPSKTFSLVPHWSVSVRFDLLMLSSFDPIDFVDVQIDSVLQARYIKSSKEGDQLCDSTSNYDSLILFYKNLTHTANTVQLKIISQTDESLSNESVVIRNLYVHVDTCHRSCATCNGPAANQCTTCPAHSTTSGTTCQCNTGYLSYPYLCVVGCPLGYIASGTSCITDPCYSNCATCETDNSACTACSSGYLYKGKCVTTCPSNSSLVAGECVDYVIQNTLLNGKYLLNGLQSTYFGNSEIAGMGLTVSGFRGNRGSSDTGALTTDCGQTYHLLGGAFLSSIAGTISVSFSGLAAHWSYYVQLKVIKIDNWLPTEQIFLTIDSVVQNTFYSAGTSNICGNSNNDAVGLLSHNSTHTASTLSLSIQTNLASNDYIESFGIREFFVVVDFCPDGCSSCNAAGCLGCNAGYSSYDLRCYNPCPDGTYTSGTLLCSACDPSCKTCSAGTSTTCTSCNDLTYLSSGSCVATCPDTFWARITDNTCAPCDSTCHTCLGPATYCTSCSGLYYLYNNAGILICPIGTYPSTVTNDNKCLPCDTSCTTCNGGTSSDCLTCTLPLYYESGAHTCGLTCNSNEYPDDTLPICQSCHTSCTTCIEGATTDCLSCSGILFLTTLSTCSPTCDTNQFKDTSSNICSACNSSCATCSGAANNNCLTCALPLYFQPLTSQCVAACNSDQYKSATPTPICVSCNSSCATCFGSASNSCLSCNSPLTYNSITKTCETVCPNGFYLSTNVCKACDSTCLTCSGPSYQNCLSCTSEYILTGTTCSTQCPSGFAMDDQKQCTSCSEICVDTCTGINKEDCAAIKRIYQLIFHIVCFKLVVWIASSVISWSLDRRQYLHTNKIYDEKQINDHFNIEEYTDSETPPKKGSPMLGSPMQGGSTFNLSPKKLKHDRHRVHPLEIMQETNFVSTNAGTTTTLSPSVMFSKRRYSERVTNKNPIGSEPFFPESKESDKQSASSESSTSNPQTYTANHKLKFSIIGNEWVSLFLFFDPKRSRINRTVLIFVKYGMFVFICENFSLEPMYFIPVCLGAGLALKWALNTSLLGLSKVTRHSNKIFFLLLLAVVITYLIISFFPDTNRLAYTKDQKWSILYLVTFAIDFLVIQQLIGLFQYISTIKFINGQEQVKRIYQLFTNILLIEKIKHSN